MEFIQDPVLAFSTQNTDLRLHETSPADFEIVLGVYTELKGTFCADMCLINMPPQTGTLVTPIHSSGGNRSLMIQGNARDALQLITKYS